MSAKDVLAMLFERGNAMQSFWGFYITIALGLMAFFGSAQRSRRLAALVSIIFLAFAAVNLSGIYDIARQRVVFFDLLATSGSSSETIGTSSLPLQTRQALLTASEPPNPTGVVAFHIMADAGVLGAVWLLTLLRR